MSIWAERVAQSGVKAKAERVREIVDGGGGSNDVELQHLDRAGRLADQVIWVLDNVDPILINPEVLASLTGGLDVTISHLQQWAAGQGADYLKVHLEQGLGEVVRALASVPAPTSACEASAEVGSLRRSVAQYRGQAERRLEDLRSQVDAAADDLARHRDGALAEAAQAAMSTASALDAEVIRIRDEITTLLSSARTLEANQQKVFNDALTSNQEAQAKLLEESRAELAGTQMMMVDNTKTAIRHVEETMQEHLDAVEDQRAKIDELFNIAAETTVIGSYTRNAERERSAADLWRNVAVISACFAIAVGLWAAIVAGDAGADWDLLAAKAVLAAAVGGVSAYAARQSSEHRDSQRDAEHVAVQLASLKPYLADLTKDEDRDTLLIEIAQRLFGQSRARRRAGDQEDDVAALLRNDPRLLSTLLGMVKDRTAQ